MNYEVRPIKAINCKCNFCGKPIEKGETAFTFYTRVAGKIAGIQLHLTCVKTIAEKVI